MRTAVPLAIDNMPEYKMMQSDFENWVQKQFDKIEGTTSKASTNALAKIGGNRAAGALKSALSKAPAALKASIADAHLRCTEK
ncbi:MAG: hypothetical protein HQ567_00450 [Candidatus Nealsonbacteria bacterium]|nr:hypothetical protein [Candidatus Nealsonbacteria bacterium]